MAITAADINNQRFTEVKKGGYDVDEVDVFLEWAASEVDALNRQVGSLEQQLSEASLNESAYVQEREVTTTADHKAFDAALADKDATIARLERQLEEKRADESRISQALIIAQRSGDEIISRANAQAAETIQDARDEAQRILDRANADRQSIIDSIRKLQDDREDTIDEYQELLKNMISDASRKLADLGGMTTTDRVPAHLATESSYTPSTPSPSIYASYGAEPIKPADASTYTTPQAAAAPVIAAPTPVASQVEKDLSGFGDADDSLEFDDID